MIEKADLNTPKLNLNGAAVFCYQSEEKLLSGSRKNILRLAAMSEEGDFLAEFEDEESID